MNMNNMNNRSGPFLKRRVERYRWCWKELGCRSRVTNRAKIPTAVRATGEKKSRSSGECFALATAKATPVRATRADQLSSTTNWRASSPSAWTAPAKRIQASTPWSRLICPGSNLKLVLATWEITAVAVSYCVSYFYYATTRRKFTSVQSSRVFDTPLNGILLFK